MMAFLRGSWWWARVKDSDGNTPQRPLKTKDRKTALAMEALLSTLRSGGETQIVNAVAHGTLTALQVFDAHRRGALAELRAQLNDTDVRQFIARAHPTTGEIETPWETWATRSASASTVARYRQQLEALIDMDHPALLSTLNRRAISDQLAALPYSGSTGKRYHAAWSSFFSYLVEIGVIEMNPLRSIRAPRANPSREIWLDLADIIRLIDAHPEPYRSLAALREGAGVEIGAALRTLVRDVDVTRRVVYIRGTKTASRKRTVRVDAFAWPYLEAAVQDKLPNALLFPIYAGQDSLVFREQHPAAQRAYAAHKAARKAIQIDPQYTMHDARHSYAVRHMMAGDRPELIAHNLGHIDASQVIKNYGKYRPAVDALSHTFVEEQSA
jgi:integrase